MKGQMKGDWEMRVQRTLLAAGVLLTYVGVASAAEPTPLSESQLDKVTAGTLTLDTTGTSINSCNNGKCTYSNPQDKTVGKKVTGF
jgi:hypothetical protein